MSRIEYTYSHCLNGLMINSEKTPQNFKYCSVKPGKILVSRLFPIIVNIKIAIEYSTRRKQKESINISLIRNMF